MAINRRGFLATAAASVVVPPILNVAPVVSPDQFYCDVLFDDFAGWAKASEAARASLCQKGGDASTMAQTIVRRIDLSGSPWMLRMTMDAA